MHTALGGDDHGEGRRNGVGVDRGDNVSYVVGLEALCEKIHRVFSNDAHRHGDDETFFLGHHLITGLSETERHEPEVDGLVLLGKSHPGDLEEARQHAL